MEKKHMRKKPRPKAVRDWQRKRTREWRQGFYALGYTYKKISGHWGWIKKKPRPVRLATRVRIHSDNPKEIEELRRKIREASKK
jgi:hypothetical protein